MANQDKLDFNVSVFSAASIGDGAYVDLAMKLGKALAAEGFTTVNGGGPGLMDIVAKGAFEAGGQVMGIALEFEGRAPSQYNTKSEVYRKLVERQKRINDLGQAYIALPGGIGTLYEIMDILAQKRAWEISGNIPVIFLGRDFWKPLVSMIDMQISKGFVSKDFMNNFRVVDSVDEVITELKQYRG